MELSSSPVMESGQRFSADSSAHFAQSHYSFPPTSGQFSIDQNLDIGDGYTPNTSSNITSRVNSGGDIASTNDSLTQEGGHMGSLTNAQRHGSALGQHKGSHDTQDSSMIGGDPKRKRSKVSRACDQCRRKKVRCDADTESNVLKTCSHCQKAGQICEFSRIPQKRGPSKGYIKELSERVQQVEGQLALQYSPGLRSSVDGPGGGVFGEHAYSPEEDETLRRQSSFSLQRNPFADFNRDRIPSIGGWHGASNTQALRDRSSIAIPPDQQYPNILQHSVKPFWTEFSEPPMKRRKVSHEDTQVIEIQQDKLDIYYRDIHSSFPILADAATTLAICQGAKPIYQHAFATALNDLQISVGATKPSQNNNDDNFSAILGSPGNAEETLCSLSTSLSSLRSDTDNLTLMWAAVLRAINTESDVLRWNQGTLSKTRALTISMDLIKDYLRGFELRSEDQRNHKSHWFRGWHCVALLTRLHALGLAEEDPSLETRFFHVLTRPKQSLPPAPAYLCYAAGYLDRIADLNAEILNDPGASRTLDKLRLQAHLRELTEILDVSDLDPLVQEMNQFIRLLIVRVGSPAGSPDILGVVSSLISTLHGKITHAQLDVAMWDPLCSHTFTIATLSLLELAALDYYKVVDVSNSLGLLKHALEIIDERHTSKSLDHGENSKRPQLHWASALLQIIKTRTNEKEVNGVDAIGTSPPATRAVMDLGILIRRGYLHVLIEYANKSSNEPSYSSQK